MPRREWCLYRCCERCGNRSIKQETIELATLDALFNEILVPGNIDELQKEVMKQSNALDGNQKYQ